MGNRWFKVNLHVHAEKSDPTELVKAAADAGIDLIAITDHQSFDYYDAVAMAAASAAPKLTVLPGIEITSHEGVHVLAILPEDYTTESCTRLLGWLEIQGDGDTKQASTRNLGEIFQKTREEGGIIVVPHPFTQGIGMLDSARKISTKLEWLESGHVGLVQINEEKVKHIGWDKEGNWINRYVLASASDDDVIASKYCLAPFNRTDAHGLNEVPDNCSWFRMSEPSIEGLKQVACEPRTRISRTEPPPGTDWVILGLRVKGGYCDGQVFRFNAGLNCFVGMNHAGKSAVLDFLRFGLEADMAEPKQNGPLYARLYGILGLGGAVEVVVNAGGEVYLVKRTFNPTVNGATKQLEFATEPERAKAYRLEREQNSLTHQPTFRFPVEVYEQGRISKLRNDLGRQLEMLDEFAGCKELKSKRAGLVSDLGESATALAPLYDERERLQGEVAGLAALQEELANKSGLMPLKAEEQKWSGASAFVNRAEGIENQLNQALGNLPFGEGNPEQVTDPEAMTDLDRLFGQNVPPLDTSVVVLPTVLQQWQNQIRAAVEELNQARQKIEQAVMRLGESTKVAREQWSQELNAHERALATKLSAAGVESPQELIARVAEIRRAIGVIQNQKQPRLEAVNTRITELENKRGATLLELERTDKELTQRRSQKAQELTGTLGGKIKVEVQRGADRGDYLQKLTEICGALATRESQIKNRDTQLTLVVQRLTPIELARALKNGGDHQVVEGVILPLTEFCKITENTQSFLCRIAANIRLLNQLETVSVPDVPKILVQRRGETALAELGTGLSPGEQSATILTLALQTRAMPLIIDQPEDELGYSYVVHLIVPKILEAKFSRQIIVVSHNANIPVLGDADFVIKMENRPRSTGGRICVVADSGGFESASVTKALIDLEGGIRAFDFRRHRYAMPENGWGKGVNKKQDRES